MTTCLKEFQDFVKGSDQLQSGPVGETFIIARLFAEIGNLHQLEHIQTKDETQLKLQITLKLGDILWYAVALAIRIFPTLHINYCKPSKSDEIVEMISQVADDPKEKQRHLELISRILSRIKRLRCDIEKVCANNIRKNKRYLDKSSRLDDSIYPQFEQLPRSISMYFHGGAEKLRIFVKTAENEFLQIGDALTDNSHRNDDYRFHDVFHMAFAAYLGWSPVLRGLLKRKRKSRPNIDEIEDGARAAILEEAISAVIFEHYLSKSLFVGAKKSVSFEVLDFIKIATSGLEVNMVHLDSWEQAIRKGIECFEQLTQWGNGIVAIRNAKRLSVVPGNLGMDAKKIDLLLNNTKSLVSRLG